MKLSSHDRIIKIVLSGLFAAIIFVLTAFFPIPLGHGYANAGDVFVVLSGIMMGPWAGLAAAGVGSAMADLYLGYSVYAPATFVIKALMVLVAVSIKRATPKLPDILRAILSGVAAELVMVTGYFLYEIILYGAAGALLNIPFNLAQGGIAITAATVLSFVLSRMPLPEVLCSQWTLFGKGFTKK